MACSQQQCYLFGGEKEGIFFLSKSTGAGDEIGWDFVDSVRKGRFSFTAFCDVMTQRYKTTNPQGPNFMSPKTFGKWWLSWVAALKIDFRQEIDPICKYDPKMLVSVSFASKKIFDWKECFEFEVSTQPYT